MSAEFARLLIKNLNDRINSKELEGTDVRRALLIYRNSVQETMLAMGHTL